VFHVRDEGPPLTSLCLFNAPTYWRYSAKDEDEMTEAELREAVLDIIQDVAGLDDKPEVEGSKPLREQLELDSMDFLDIVMELRKRHKIEVPEADYPKLASLDSTVEYLKGRFAK
jgi:acyl carrier protein